MTLDNLSSVLLRNIEQRNWSDASVRAEVYAIARNSLERFFESTPAVDPAPSRAQMERAIAAVEAHFCARSLEGLVNPTEAIEETSLRSPTDPDARGVDGALVAAPPVVRKTGETETSDRSDDPTPAKAPPSEARSLPAVDEDATATVTESAGEAGPVEVPEPDEGSSHAEARAIANPTSKDDVTEMVAPEDASADDESLFETTEHSDPQVRSDEGPDGVATSQRFRQVLGAIALTLLVVAWSTDLAGVIRRWVVERTDPGEIARPSIAEIQRVNTPDVAQPNRPLLRQLPNRNGASALLRIESPPDRPRAFDGHLVWTPTEVRSGGVTAWSGRLEFDGSPISIDLALERDDGPPDDKRRILGLVLSSFGDASIENMELARWEPPPGERREVDGLSVRIGQDRFLAEFALEPADTSADFDLRTMFEVVFTAEGRRRWVFQFTLPGPL